MYAADSRWIHPSLDWCPCNLSIVEASIVQRNPHYRLPLVDQTDHLTYSSQLISESIGLVVNLISLEHTNAAATIETISVLFVLYITKRATSPHGGPLLEVDEWPPRGLLEIRANWGYLWASGRPFSATVDVARRFWVSKLSLACTESP